MGGSTYIVWIDNPFL